MGTFVKGSQLVAEIENLFDEAYEELVIISPFIKLHSRLIDSLRSRIDDPKLKIRLVYGKNKSDKTKSLNKVDFDFFSQFSNISIFYEPRLHAKYYGNQDKGILSSMNLYEYSMNNNIEFGVVTKSNLVGDNLDVDAWNYFHSVIEGSLLEFEKTPVFESGMMGLRKKYLRSDITVDLLSKTFEGKSVSKNRSAVKGIKNKENNLINKGYCIRTGELIKFNIAKPYTDNAFKSWSYFKNLDFKEKYCHFSGELSDGQTTMAKPILVKHWKAAKKQFNLK